MNTATVIGQFVVFAAAISLFGLWSIRRTKQDRERERREAAARDRQYDLPLVGTER